MDIRLHTAMVMHLDKCVGCHVCSISCKNIWTDRKGSEYMWWNNVETKPGVGYPAMWEDQERYKGGWRKDGNNLSLKANDRFSTFCNLFYNPNMAVLEDYYHPWTYSYEDLFTTDNQSIQPTAKPVSAITRKGMNLEWGPNWDDDFSGSTVFAKEDPNIHDWTEKDKQAFFQMESMVFQYLPRMCNHCVNPACAAACPSGAIYKRNEDSVVLVDHNKCRGWRMCVTACPYKKIYFNWNTAKAEKCINCYPRLETKQTPACFHSCTGRLRYFGMVFIDADRIYEVATKSDQELAEAQRSLILDPNQTNVVEAAKQKGYTEDVIEAVKRSPVYQWVSVFKMALPLHPEFRTLPMVFYVPPLSPVISNLTNDVYSSDPTLFSTLENSRFPIQYVAKLFSAGNENVIRDIYKKLLAVRMYRRYKTVGDVSEAELTRILTEAELDTKLADSIYYLTTLARAEERMVIPPLYREQSMEYSKDAQTQKSEAGLGFLKPIKKAP